MIFLLGIEGRGTHRSTGLWGAQTADSRLWKAGITNLVRLVFLSILCGFLLIYFTDSQSVAQTTGLADPNASVAQDDLAGATTPDAGLTAPSLQPRSADRFTLPPPIDILQPEAIAGGQSDPTTFRRTTNAPTVAVQQQFGTLRGGNSTGSVLSLTVDPGLDLPGPDLGASIDGTFTGTTSVDSDNDDRNDRGRGRVDTSNGRSPVNRLPQGAESPVDRIAADPVDRGDVAGRINTRQGATAGRITAVEPISPSGLINPAGDPLAAVGFRVGTFDVFPVVNLGLGYTSNSDNVAGGTGSIFGSIEPEIEARSDWERHSLTLSGSALLDGIVDSADGVDVSFSANADLTLDLTDVDQLSVSVGYGFSQEDSSEEGNNTVVRSTDVHALSGSITYQRNAGLIGLAAGIDAQYTSYSGGEVIGGAAFDNSADRTNAFIRPFARASFNPGALFEPFAEVGLRTRIYPNSPDAAGIDRNATGYDAALGINFDSGSFISGSAAVGYVFETTDDNSLADVSAVSFSGGLSYAPTDDLTFVGSLSTDVGSTTLAGSAGRITYNADLEATYAVREDLDLSARIGGAWETYAGDVATSTTGEAGLGAVYRVNRMMQIYADYDYARREGDSAASSYDDHTFELGIRLQH